MVHDKLIDKPLDFVVKCNVRLHLQHDWRCFPANDHIVDFEHQLILDSATLVHDELVVKLPEFVFDFVNGVHL